jgi:hypothetical protein
MNNKKPGANNVTGLKPLPPQKTTVVKPNILESSNRTALESKPANSKKVTKMFEAVKKKQWSNKKG